MSMVQALQLSWREDAVGGKVLQAPRISDSDRRALAVAANIVLLLHGYNNTMEDAEEAYAGFHARQAELDPTGRYTLGRTFVHVFWPGDAKWSIASFFFYPWSIAQAKRTAKLLAEYLAGLYAGQAPRIDIVAHSMGCRLALEMLRTLDEHASTLGVARVVCMAGAVPTFKLDDDGRQESLRPGFDQVLREGARSLWSGSDQVLSLAFPLGQSVAPGDEGSGPTALGHEFWVNANVPLALGQDENRLAGHSDYWGWNTDPAALECARFAAGAVRDYLRFPSAGSRTVASRRQVEVSAIVARHEAKAREPTAREPSSREPPY